MQEDLQRRIQGTKPPPLSKLDSHLGYWLRLVSNQVSLAFRRKLEAHGITVSEWVALRKLYDADRMSPGALAESMAMTKGAVSKIIAHLEGAGHIRRESDHDDGRARFLLLTQKGRALVPILAHLADENDCEFFGALTPRDRKALQTHLRNIARDNDFTDIPVD